MPLKIFFAPSLQSFSAIRLHFRTRVPTISAPHPSSKPGSLFFQARGVLRIREYTNKLIYVTHIYIYIYIHTLFCFCNQSMSFKNTEKMKMYLKDCPMNCVGFSNSTPDSQIEALSCRFQITVFFFWTFTERMSRFRLPRFLDIEHLGENLKRKRTTAATTELQL